MTEKDMIQDTISSNLAIVLDYTKAHLSCKNKHIRQKIKFIRDGSEQFNMDLYELCVKKGYNTPIKYVSDVEVLKTKNFLEDF